MEEYINENLMKAKEQGNESQKFAGLQNETQFGVAKPQIDSGAGHSHGAEAGGRRVQGDGDDGHSNNQLYSCGSLAPKLKRGGGCMDHGFQRAKE